MRAVRATAVFGVLTVLTLAVAARPVSADSGGSPIIVLHPVLGAGGKTVGTNLNLSKATADQNEGAIAINPTNPQQVFVVSNDDVGNVGLFAATSSNGGMSFTSKHVATGTDGLPSACCDASASWDAFGNLFLGYETNTFQTEVAVSTNGGASFTALATLGTANNVDQPTVTTGAGEVWVDWNDNGVIKASGAAVTALGTVGSFSTPQSAPSGAGSFGDIAIGPSGQVMVTYQDNTGGQGASHIYVNVDPDGLGSMGFGSRITVTGTNVGGFDFIPAQPDRSVDAEAGLAWDRSGGTHNGRVYLIYTDENPDESNNMDIQERFSDDNGATWSSAVRVNDDATTRSQFLPRIALDQSTGFLGATWYDSRNDGGVQGSGSTNNVANDDAVLWGSFSTDGGATWQANTQIGAGISHSGGTCPTMSALFADIDYGDYSGNWFQGGTLYPVWADDSNVTHDNPDGALKCMDLYTAPFTATVASGVPPSISVSDVDVLEGNSGTTTANFTVALSANPSAATQVTVATANSTASAGSDYVAVPATVLTWNPGDPLAKTVSVTVNGDTLKEGDETFTVKLSSPVNAVLADPAGTGTIMDDDGRFFFSVGDTSVTEGNSGTATLSFPVSISALPAAGQTEVVRVATADGTATAGSDYTAVPLTTLTWTSSSPSLTQTVSVSVTGDTAVEPNETLFLNLSGNSKNAVLSDKQGVGTIVNDDGSSPSPPPPSISVSDVDKLEGNSGTSTAQFTVALSANPSTQTKVTVATANGTAMAPSDYTAVPATVLTWNPGDPLAKTVSVTVNGDTLREGDEAFTLKLSSTVAATLADAAGTGTIMDDDGRFFFSVGDTSVTEGNSGTATMSFPVSISALPAAGQTEVVKVATADGTATAGSDYTAVPLTTLNWTSSSPSLTQTVSVSVSGDTAVEPNETLFLNLSGNSKNAVLSDKQGVGTIVNDD